MTSPSIISTQATCPPTTARFSCVALLLRFFVASSLQFCIFPREMDGADAAQNKIPISNRIFSGAVSTDRTGSHIYLSARPRLCREVCRNFTSGRVDGSHRARCDHGAAQIHLPSTIQEAASIPQHAGIIIRPPQRITLASPYLSHAITLFCRSIQQARLSIFTTFTGLQARFIFISPLPQEAVERDRFRHHTSHIKKFI